MKIDGMTPLLQVFDMAASVAFYRDVLGFSVVTLSGNDVTDSDWVMLGLGQTLLMLNTAYERGARPPAPDPVRVKAHGDTSLFFGCDDADAVYAHLRAKGRDARELVTAPYGMRQVYAEDPDGYEVCFQHPVAVS